MIFSNSRYQTAGVYTVTRPDGTVVNVVRPSVPASNPVAGFYSRQQGERLDQIAQRFLQDATLFWALCDANNSMMPDALASRALIGIPTNAG